MIGIRRLTRSISQAGALLALVSIGGPSLAIEGGAPARSGDRLARATVAVGLLSQPSSGANFDRCSGVLIRPDVILTAAHCVSDSTVSAAVLFYNGSRPIPTARAIVAVTRSAVAPGRIASDDLAARLRELSLDIALLRLASPVRDRAPIPLARNRQAPPATLLLAGAGLSGEGSGILRTATLRPIAITDTGLVIASVIGARVCVGDSGGPVVTAGRGGPALWGVASAVISSRPPCGDIVVVAPAALLGR